MSVDEIQLAPLFRHGMRATLYKRNLFQLFICRYITYYTHTFILLFILTSLSFHIRCLQTKILYCLICICMGQLKNCCYINLMTKLVKFHQIGIDQIAVEADIVFYFVNLNFSHSSISACYAIFLSYWLALEVILNYRLLEIV